MSYKSKIPIVQNRHSAMADFIHTRHDTPRNRDKFKSSESVF